MGNDLPDYQSQVVGAGLEATSFRSGLDADKPASPAAGDIWLARDTFTLYICMVAGAWVSLTPAGTIVMWHGLLSAIPTGWALCDGTLGTPNLVDKFVKGVATAATDPGATGGGDHSHNVHVSGAPYGQIGGTYIVAPPGGNLTTPGTGTGSGLVYTYTDAADGSPAYYEVAFIMKL